MLIGGQSDPPRTELIREFNFPCHALSMPYGEYPTRGWLPDPTVIPEVMIALVGAVKELEHQKKIVVAVATEVFERSA